VAIGKIAAVSFGLMLAGFMLTSCAEKPAVFVSTPCPEIHTWSKDQQVQAALELSKLPHDAVIRGMLREAAELRNAARKCIAR